LIKRGRCNDLPCEKKKHQQSQAYEVSLLQTLCGRKKEAMSMTRTLSIVLLSSFFTLLALQSTCAAEPKWKTIFNGTDFDGWNIVSNGDPAFVTIDNGMFVLEQKSNTSEHTFLTTKEKYGDFILELDVNADVGFNSGILLRCADAPATAKVRLNGYQVKIDDTPRAWTGGIFDDFGGNWKWLHDLKDNAAARSAFKLGEWAHVRIECLGSAIRVWVNHIPTAHLLDGKYPAGYIAFKIHAMGKGKDKQPVIRFKNIRVITEQPELFAQRMELVARRAPPLADADNGDIQLPDGFRATVVADNLVAQQKGNTLRFLAVAKNGDIYALSRKGGIFALRDKDGDGKADIIQEFGSGGGTGIAIHKNYLYYSSASAVFRYQLMSGELIPKGEPELIAQLPEQNAHDAKSIAFDPAGDLYVSVGSPHNVFSIGDRAKGAKGIDPTDHQKKHGGIWRFKSDVPNQTQDKDGFRFATGMRHVLSLAWNPTKNAFFMVMMGRDQLNTIAPDYYTQQDNAELPAEEMHILHEGSHVGWPFTYYDPIKKVRMVNPEFGGDNKKQAEPGIYPDPVIAFPAHWAPMQMAFNTTQQFPNKYFGGAFVAFHGSWNRAPKPQAGYCVAFVPFNEQGMPTGDYEIFASGFAGKESIKSPGEARFRPCGVTFGNDGTLYVSDSVKGRIWRIAYTGEKMNQTMPHSKEGQKQTDVASPAINVSSEMKRNALAYKNHCAICHMDAGGGVPGLQPSLLDSDVVKGDAQKLIRVILRGPDQELSAGRQRYANVMPPMHFLSDDDIAAALSYVREQFAPSASPITPEQVQEQRKENGYEKSQEKSQEQIKP
jgi:glucose/arabinose dehydrogenase/mono/diheme cytochrome c family protein